MYKFKIPEAEVAVKDFLSENPNHAVAKKALKGDAAAMLAVYKEMAGDSEFEDGPSLAALQVLNEACNQKYTPAMVRMSEVEMCQGSQYWPEGLNQLLEAMRLGDEAAKGQLKFYWKNKAKELEHVEEPLDAGQQFAVGFYYWYGIAVRKSVKKAESYMLRAAAKGCKEAEALLKEKYPKSYQEKISAERCRAYRYEGREAENDHKPAAAIKAYLKAVQIGDGDSFRSIIRLSQDAPDTMQSSMSMALKAKSATKESDVAFVDAMWRITADEMMSSDVARLLQIARDYDILVSCTEELCGWIESSPF